MAAAEAGGSALEVGGLDPGLIQEELGHQPAGGGTLGAEGEAPARQGLEPLRRLEGLQATAAVGNENAAELGIDPPLGDHPRSGGLQPGLHLSLIHI